MVMSVQATPLCGSFFTCKRGDIEIKREIGSPNYLVVALRESQRDSPATRFGNSSVVYRKDVVFLCAVSVPPPWEAASPALSVLGGVTARGSVLDVRIPWILCSGPKGSDNTSD